MRREEQGWLWGALSNRNTETTCAATGPYNSHWSIQQLLPTSYTQWFAHQLHSVVGYLTASPCPELQVQKAQISCDIVMINTQDTLSQPSSSVTVWRFGGSGLSLVARNESRRKRGGINQETSCTVQSSSAFRLIATTISTDKACWTV